MAKGNRQNIIDEIVSSIELRTSRAKILAKICEKWRISSRTFDRLWRDANEQYSRLQCKAKEAADSAYINSMEDAAKMAIMSKAERLQILSKIARGELTFKDSGAEVVIPIETLERIRAIAELNKMGGDYAPTKIAQTDTTGKDIPLDPLSIANRDTKLTRIYVPASTSVIEPTSN